MTTKEEQNELKMLLDNTKDISKKALVDPGENLPGHRYDEKTYAMRSLKFNKTDEEIISNLKSMYNLSNKDATKLVKTSKAHLKKQYKEYKDSVAEKNILILQQIAEDALDEGQKRIAIEAVKELNKMCGIGLPSTFVQNNTQINLDNIEINFK